MPVAVSSTVGNTKTDSLKSKNYECTGCGLFHYHAKTAVTCCPFSDVAGELSSEVAERFMLPEFEAVRAQLGIQQVALKCNDSFTARVVFTNQISCDSWKRKFEIANCVDFGDCGAPKSQPGSNVASNVDTRNSHTKTAHCSRAGISRIGIRNVRHTTRKMESTNCECKSCLRLIYHTGLSDVTVYINSKHTHMIGMEGLRYIHLSEQLVSEVARRITDKVADVVIVNGMFF